MFVASSTSRITSYIGVITLLRKDSEPPPYAGVKVSPADRMVAPTNILCMSYAIYENKKAIVTILSMSSFKLGWVDSENTFLSSLIESTNNYCINDD